MQHEARPPGATGVPGFSHNPEPLQTSILPSPQQRRLAIWLHETGPRSLCHLLLELSRLLPEDLRPIFWQRVERYADMDLVTLRILGADRFPRPQPTEKARP